jgi:hypothetical protein
LPILATVGKCIHRHIRNPKAIVEPQHTQSMTFVSQCDYASV